MLKKVETINAPAAIGPYSQGMVIGNILFTSGQLPIDPATGELKGDNVTDQAEQAIANIGAILKEAGSSFEKVAKANCFLSDMADFAAFNEVYSKYFTGKPARICVAVKTLPKNALIELDVIAEI